MDKETFPGPIQLPLAQAREWEAKYQKDTENEEEKNKMKAFLIPIETLKKVIDLNTSAARAYLAINDQNEKVLFFVGAEKDPKTGKYVDVYGQEGAEENSGKDGKLDGGDVVYDAARPSPPY